MKLIQTLTALLLATSAHAEFLTGNELLEKLNASDSGIRLMGYGYVAGVHDAGRGAVHCSPQSITIKQIGDMAQAYLTNAPSERHHNADGLMLRMFGAVRPCEKKQQKPAAQV